MPLIVSFIKGFFNGITMFQFKTVLTIGETEYSYGPHGYAHYYHWRKDSWKMSGSISNEKLKKMIEENKRIIGELNE